MNGAYDPRDERTIRVARLVEDWTKSGLLTAEQRAVLMPQLEVDLRRTNRFLRITLFVFGAIIIQSALGLGALMLGLSGNRAIAVGCTIGGVACYWLAGVLVTKYKLYRFGVEEAVALAAVGLVAVGFSIAISLAFTPRDWPLIAGLLAAVVAAFTVHLRFGYVYAAIIAMVCATALPFQFGDSEATQRVAAILVLGVVAAAARIARAGHGDEYPGDTYAAIEAVAWVGIYALVNLQASTGFSKVNNSAWFYWLTYAGIWILPAVGLWLSLRERSRPLLDVSVLMALATLLSNKLYLDAPRYPWDPIVFGLLLMGVAVGVRRWLSAGEGGERYGYTASRLLASDDASLADIAIVSAAHTNVPVAETAAPVEPSIGGGGRSGGAGSSGSF